MLVFFPMLCYVMFSCTFYYSPSVNQLFLEDGQSGVRSSSPGKSYHLSTGAKIVYVDD